MWWWTSMIPRDLTSAADVACARAGEIAPANAPRPDPPSVPAAAAATPDARNLRRFGPAFDAPGPAQHAHALEIARGVGVTAASLDLPLDRSFSGLNLCGRPHPHSAENCGQAVPHRGRERRAYRLRSFEEKRPEL